MVYFLCSSMPSKFSIRAGVLVFLFVSLIGGAFWFWQQQKNDASPAQAQVQAAALGNITTVAGFGSSGYSGDGGLATSAEIDAPNNVFVDSAGNLYIADYFNDVIRKVAVGTQIISTVAGNGTAGYSGDGGPATSAQLSGPTSVVVDTAGNIYIADNNNDRVRKVDLLGDISTFAGTGTGGYTGDGAAATAAQIDGPADLAFDAFENLYIAEYTNCVIRKVTMGTGFISTVAGTGACGFSGNGGLATSAQIGGALGLGVDSAGNIYIAEQTNNLVRKVNTGGFINAFAGTGVPGFSGDGGLATSAQFDAPFDVTPDTTGNVFIVDRQNHRIRKVNALGTITTVVGTGTPSYGGDGGPATSAQLNAPVGVHVTNDGRLYIGDNGNDRVRLVTIDTTPLPPFSFMFGSSGASTGQFSLPDGIVTDSAGNIYVSDSGNQRIQKFDSSGNFLLAWGSLGTGNGQFAYPAGIAIDSSDNIYVSDNNNHRVQKFTSSGAFVWNIGKNGGDGTAGTGNGEFSNPNDVATDDAGNVYVADWLNLRVQLFTSGGVFISKFTTPDAPYGIAVDSNHDIYTVSSDNVVRKYTSSGTPILNWGTSGTGNGQFNSPIGVDVDSMDNVYVSDFDNNRIQKFDYLGNFIDKMGRNGGDGTAGTAHRQFARPRSAFINAAGVVFVADSDNTRIQVFDAANPFPFSVLSTTPAINGVNLVSTIAVQFNDSLNTSTVTNANLRVFSNKRGLLAGSFSFSTTSFTDDTATFTPTDPFQSGEQISFSVTTNIQNSSATPVAPYAGDFFTASADGSDSFAVASYATGTTYATTSTGGMCSADYDQDGLVDILVSDNAGGTDGFSYYHNSGAGVFAAPVHTNTGQSFGAAVICDDLNNDGFPDIAVPNGPLYVFIGNADGTFAAPSSYPLSDDSYMLTAADFNRDGTLDIAVGLATNSSGFDILLNIGSGNFGPATFVSAGGSCSGNVGLCTLTIADGDFNNDGKSDIVLLDIDGDEYVTALGVGDGTFGAPSSPGALTGNSFRWIMTGDLNNDGNVDIVPINGGQGRFEVVLGNGDGTFDAAVPYTLSFGGGTSTHGALADIDGDGFLDVIIATAGASNMQVARNDGTGVFTAFPEFILPGANYLATVAVADFNTDGAVDIAYLDYTQDTLFVNINDIAGPVVAVIQPNGGESLTAGTIYDIEWSATDNSNTVRSTDLDFSANNGTSWSPITTNLPFISKWGTTGTGAGQFDSPIGVAIAADGSVYVVDRGNDRIQKFTSTGGFLFQWGTSGSVDGEFNNPQDIAVNSNGDVYVVDHNNSRIQVFDSSGVFIAKWGVFGAGDSEFDQPDGIGIDASDNVYVADTSNHRIQKFSSAGTFLTKWGVNGAADGEFNFPEDVAIDSVGDVYVTDGVNERIQKFSSSGTFITKWGSVGAGAGQFEYPYYIATDANDNIFVTDGDNFRVEQFDTVGAFIGQWGRFGTADGGFGYPAGIGVNSAGYVYVVDTDNDRIERFLPPGTFLWTVPNTGTTQARIRATSYDLAGNSGQDTSDAVFTIVATGGGGGGSPPGRLAPTAPTAVSGSALNITSIRWNFTDTATNETGFRLFDDQNSVLVDVMQPDLSFIDEISLLPNTLYSGRTVKAYNDSGESSASATFEPVATLMPSTTVHVISRNLDSIVVGINQTMPNLDQGQSGVQFELIDTISAAATTTSPWLQTSTYTFTSLQVGHSYSIRVHSRNQAAVETDWSPFIATSTLAQNEPKLEASLAVSLVDDGAITGEPLDPTKDLLVSVAVSNSGGGEATNVFLRLPVPAGLLVVPGTTIVDGFVQSVAADQDLAQLQNGILSVIWPRLAVGDTVHVSTHLRFNVTHLRALTASVQASANPSFLLQASVSANETTDISTSSAVTVTPDLALLPPVAPTPTPIPTPTPVPPPTTPPTAPTSPTTPGSPSAPGSPTSPSAPTTPTTPTTPTPTQPGTTTTTAEPGQIISDFLTFVSDIGLVSGVQAIQEQVELAQTPIQTTLSVTAPLVIISSVPLWGYLPYAPVLFYHFLLAGAGLFKRKKAGRSFGVVYDSIAKQPLPLAIVRVYKVDGEQKKLVTTSVTDKFGRYDALLEPGTYTVEAAKPMYQFPSQIVTTATDGERLRVFQPAMPITVTAQGMSLPDVPLDPVNVKRARQVAGFFKKMWMSLQSVGSHFIVPLLLVGLIVSIVSVVTVPNAINIVLMLIYLGLLSAQLKLRPKLLKAWGVVYEFASNAILPLTTVQLIDPVSSKVVSTRLSDYDGRFSFLPEPGTYKVKASKQGFDHVTDVKTLTNTTIKDRAPLTDTVSIKKPNERVSGDVAMKQVS